MMTLGLAIALGLTIYACGGGGKKAENPNDAAAEFNNPTGTLTADNANDVANQAVDSKNSNGVVSSSSILSKTPSRIDNKYLPYAVITADAIQECVETSSNGQNSTTDWACLAPYLGNDEVTCTGSGTTEYTFNDSDNFTTTEFNDWSLNCSGDASLTVTCDGTQSASLDAPVTVCSNMSCVSEDFTWTWEGCVQGDNYLVRLDDESFVIESIEANGTCTTVTLSIVHAGGTDTITCNVSSASDSCTGLDGVETVTSCTID